MSATKISLLPPLDPKPIEVEETKSLLDQILQDALAQFELFHDQNKECYAKSLSTGLVWRLNSRAFRDEISTTFYEQHAKALRAQTLADTIAQLSALARCKNIMREVHQRVAKHDGKYYLDLCEANTTRAICWHAGGWAIVSHPPVEFVRSDAMQPLPIPTSDASLDALWKLCNIPLSKQIFVIAWIIDAWRPDTVYPGLELIGEQGSGKSTTAEIIRMLVDPNACNLRSAPKSKEDVFVTAGVNHVVAYENLSHLSGEMQDNLCVLSTGGGHAKRKLYSDADEHVINVKRPWILNGISACVTQQDLVDRVISIECPVIKSRIAEREQKLLLTQQLPKILAALLDIACKAEAHIAKVLIPAEKRPRLLEFCQLGMAITKHMHKDEQKFLTLFSQDRQELISRAIETSPVCAALIELMVHETMIEAPLSIILSRLKRPEYCDSWPRSPKGLGDLLRRNAPALRQCGIQCKSLGKIGSHVHWRISKMREDASLASRDVVKDQNNAKHDKTTCTTLSGTSCLQDDATQTWEQTL
ncbi:hypothetical protein QWY20_01050 [Alkalimonas sp. MEB108]|uniref:DUF927 domain-containing protein n=1 Tax=Alkalimonas cellulosilytica TaxID=3058395 RepID=A0ABU7J0J7_9GAMM|nr:hypothetical protein [Alkalimonas sp. MEB108]MEE2000024.1 hypothetical protein [Alkalimonas sp. MEB108]